jgi:hypothetical protein
VAGPAGELPPEAAAFRDLPVGPSRHTVRFVLADGVLYALKELPSRVARKEYQVPRQLEARMLPAVQVIGLVEQPTGGNAILVTEFLSHSRQYRRLFQRLPRLAKHRERLLDAMAILLVDLHRAGVYWATARWPTPCSGGTARRCRRSWWTPRPARSTRPVRRAAPARPGDPGRQRDRRPARPGRGAGRPR